MNCETMSWWSGLGPALALKSVYLFVVLYTRNPNKRLNTVSYRDTTNGALLYN